MSNEMQLYFTRGDRRHDRDAHARHGAQKDVAVQGERPNLFELDRKPIANRKSRRPPQQFDEAGRRARIV